MNPFFGSGRTLKNPFTKDFEQPGIRIMVPVESIGISQEAFATLINTGREPSHSRDGFGWPSMPSYQHLARHKLVPNEHKTEQSPLSLIFNITFVSLRQKILHMA